MRLNPNSSTLSRHFVLLAPPCSDTSGFRQVEFSRSSHASMLAAIQRLRASVYLDDKAIGPANVTADGRHVQAVDEKAWHLATLNTMGEVSACARLVLYGRGVSYPELGVSQSALARSASWSGPLRAAVEAELARARREGLTYAEAGGWAIAKSLRCGTEAVRVMVALYALSARVGGVLGLTTAKCSSSAPVLRKIGGRPLEFEGVELPRFYEPKYRCDLEVLRFDSSSPNPKFERGISDAIQGLSVVPVISGAWSPALLPVSQVTVSEGLVAVR